jgi:hypothetical protein
MTTSAEQGDMQYYDGSAWVVVNSPTDTDVVNTLRFVDGKPTWAPTYYEIGDRGPAGGFVFYVTDGGLHGLEAAPSDQGTEVAWGCIDDYVSGAAGVGIGDGRINTAAILLCESVDGAAVLAATSYVLNGYDDWFLPSRGELAQLHSEYLSSPIYDGFANIDGYYWSSSQSVISDRAWVVDFSAPSQYAEYEFGKDERSGALSVRSVRSF